MNEGQNAQTEDTSAAGEPVPDESATGHQEAEGSQPESSTEQPQPSDSDPAPSEQSGPGGRRLRIGSQRWSTKVPPKPASKPATSEKPQAAEPPSAAPAAEGVSAPPPETSTPAEPSPPAAPQPAAKPVPAPLARSEKRLRVETPRHEKIQPPSTRGELPEDLQLELAAALGGISVEEILAGQSGAAQEPELEPDARTHGRVIAVHRDHVFLDLGGRKQGVVSVRNFESPPEAGTQLELVVSRFDPAEGLYELRLPGGAVDVGDWSEVTEGMVVEARVTGHNKGGLECEVSKLRAFIPASQVSLYRVDDLAQFVGEKFTCVVTEANPEKRNLVLSRRGVLEREKAEAKETLMAQLEVGQSREGVVRSLQEFGAFVDLGGVDGLVHISQLSWDRLRHASEVLELGQKIKVKIQKIDPATGKISLGFRDLADNPWKSASRKYSARSTVKGTVTRIMEFGVFVKLEPGVEGLVHISELSHKRVWRASDILSEGQEVEVLVLSVDEEHQRMSLSLKALEARATPAAKASEEAEEPEAAPVATRAKPSAPLKGGIGRSSGGEKFGLKW